MQIYNGKRWISYNVNFTMGSIGVCVCVCVFARACVRACVNSERHQGRSLLASFYHFIFMFKIQNSILYLQDTFLKLS